jgi:hypothetical protein
VIAEPAESQRRTRLERVQRLTAYGPIVVTALILTVQAVFPNFIQALPVEASIALLAGSVVFLVWHVEMSLVATRAGLAQLETGVVVLEGTQRDFIQASSSLSQARLGRMFAEVATASPRVGRLRIFAISSQQILSFVKFHDISIEKCELLVRSFDPSDAAHKDFHNQIRLVVADWHRLKTSGRIGELEVRTYDFFPTEYECIFDRDHLILGLYDSDPSDYSEVSVRDPLLIRGTSDGGRLMISEFAERFDHLFEVCRTHHGDFSYQATL